MPIHHKGRATTSEGRRGAPRGSLLWPFGGRRERLTVSWHRRRVHSYPNDQSSDHTYHLSVEVGNKRQGWAGPDLAGPAKGRATMRITLAAVGRAKAGPARDLYELYAGRLSWQLVLKEVEERRPLAPPALKQREGELLLAAIPETARLIALDEAGKSMASADLARLIGRWRDEGTRELAIAIGAPKASRPMSGRGPIWCWRWAP